MGIFGVTCIFAMNPLLLALYFYLLQLSYRPTQTQRTNQLRVCCAFGAGALGLTVMVAFCYLVKLLPCGVAVGKEPALSKNPWQGFEIGTVASLPFWLACIWFY